jgi:hypothetical protein
MRTLTAAPSCERSEENKRKKKKRKGKGCQIDGLLVNGGGASSLMLFLYSETFMGQYTREMGKYIRCYLVL